MLRNQKDLLTTKILDCIPGNIKPIEYLIELLGISKESVYRRLRGEIPFTFGEISKLSLDLNFSIDELIAKPYESRILVNMQTCADNNPSIEFLKRFEHYYRFLLHLETHPDVETILTLNHIPLIASIYFKNLFQFFYFKWLHQNQEVPSKLNYSDVTIPGEIEELRKKVKFSAVNCTNKITLILDSDFFLSLINEIQYYHKRRLINDKDFEKLKNDMRSFIDLMEDWAKTGLFGQRAKMNIYLSSMNIETNATHVKYDGCETSFVYIFSIGPINSSNPAICERHKKWIHSVQKCATLITQSNELLQLEYFEKQRKLVHSSDNDSFISLY
jgi:hypothetical protein